MKDFLTIVQEAIIAVCRENNVLKEYNWQTWDSDVDVKLPRASMNMSAESQLGYGDVWMVAPEIVLQGKPRRQKLSRVMHELELTLTAANLHTVLNTKVNDTVQFFQRGENFTIRQTIDGDIRKRIISFRLAAAPLPQK